jgi:hypothetical protein
MLLTELARKYSGPDEGIGLLLGLNTMAVYSKLDYLSSDFGYIIDRAR